MHIVVVQQQITTIELMKEQSKKTEENKEQKNKNIMYERVKLDKNRLQSLWTRWLSR